MINDMSDFFEGLEQSEAFGFIMDQNGEFIPAGHPEYCLYDSGPYPYVKFADELRFLNDYCYAVSRLIYEKRTDSKESVEEQRRKPDNFNDFCVDITFAEIMIGLEDEDYKWEWLSNIVGAHLVILLYSFLEKTLKCIYQCLEDEKLASTKFKIKRPVMNFWLYKILGTDEESFRKSEPEIFTVLSAARKMRNNFAHDNLEGQAEHDSNNCKEKLDFRLIDLIDAISSVMYKVENASDFGNID